MASHDLRDVLNLPSDHATGPRPSKKQRIAAPRPNLKGLAREVQNLGGDNPIAIVPEVSVFKKRRLTGRKPAARWHLKPFRNSARGDDGALILRHWKRKTEDSGAHSHPDSGESSQSASGAANGVEAVDGSSARGEEQERERGREEIEDSAFARFNVRVDVPQYSEDQYASNLENPEWTKEETDYLLRLALDFDLRWAIIWDRYEFVPSVPAGEGAVTGGESTAVIPAPKARTMEDLKARYYEVAHKMMAVQKQAQYMTRPEFELYEMMQKFNPAQERARKEFAINTMARSKDEAREEESLLLEVKRILARIDRFNEERRDLYQRLDYPSTETDITAFKSSAGLQTLLQNLMNIDKTKKRKSIMGGPNGAGSDGASPATATAVPGSAVSETGPARRESILAASVTGGHRDSIIGTPTTPAEAATPTAANKKKGAQPAERRKLTEQEEQLYGVSHHDRLSSGPTFRYEKINKLFSHKSGQQQQRITNALEELGVSPRLTMPTASVVAQYEILWSAVNTLVDMRKVSDKLDAEIKLEEAKKAEREKTRAAAGGGGGGASSSSSASAAAVPASSQITSPGTIAAKLPGDSATSSTATGQKSVDKAPQAATVKADTGAGAGAGGETQPRTETKGQRPEPSSATAGDKDGPGAAKARPAAEADTVSGTSPAEQIKQEEGEKGAAGVRPASSGRHKRSASVLSATSDKSAKRQKK